MKVLLKLLKERHEIMIKYIQLSLIPDPAMDAKESQEGL